MNQARFQKQQREKARREKTAAKQARLEERRSGQNAEATAPPDAADQDAVLAELAELHRRFNEDEIDFEDFSAAKDELTARLDIR